MDNGKNCLAKHNELTFLEADQAIDSIRSFNISVENVRPR